MRKAEQNLDLFWAKVDDEYRREAELALDQEFTHLFKDDCQFDRTPQTAIKKPLPGAENSLQDSVSKLRLESNESQSTFSPQMPKVKSKTRSSTSFATTTAERNASPVEEDSQPTFTLKSRAFKVLKALFFQTPQPDLPGEISWAVFLYAMAAIGFAPEKLYGSV